MSHAKREHQPTGWRLGTWCSNCADPEPNGTLFERQTANFVNWLVMNGLPPGRAEAALMRLRLLEPGALSLEPVINDDYSAVDRERSGHTDGPTCWCQPRAYYVHTTERTDP